ncbi:MAG: glycoside hydrolase family 3 C-terminal domain-containing protein [Spirochaetes bacterium]|jgi:beta-glucosidase|nr:glycoside hydrolase family 3 C-terminal domain-containing protein [Spirochaetota bacterium]
MEKISTPILTHQEASQKAASVVQKMTLDEKIEFIGGHNFFFVKDCEELAIPRLYLTDATQGVHLRPDIEGQLEKSTSFPAPIALASTWNSQLAYDYARSVAEECRAGGVAVLLAPGMNIYRNSQNGRNFEYLGEDPFLAARMVENYTTAVQDRGVIATLKHFVCNNSDFHRRRSNSIVDERALFEIYLPAFKAGVDAGAMAVMTAYNQVNGEWAGQSDYVINYLLRERLGFKWLVMSDWWSVWDPKKTIESGQDLDMPGHGRTGPDDFVDFDNPFLRSNTKRLIEDGSVTESAIDRMVINILATSLAMGFDSNDIKDESYLDSFQEHVQVALQTAREGIVLLKNRDNLLPVDVNDNKKILLTGLFTKTNAFGGGAAEVEGYDVVSLNDALVDEFGENLVYREKPEDDELINADLVLLSVGTLDHEGWDSPFELPEVVTQLIEHATLLNNNVVVVMNSGRGVGMTRWIDSVAGLLYCWYPGQAGNRALAEIVSGKTNPSGKLPITIEKSFEDSPAYPYIPEGEGFYEGWDYDNDLSYPVNNVRYHEGVFVGYRWYESKGITPLFPFGYGLSYSRFNYSQMELSDTQIQVGEEVSISCAVTNDSSRDGSEVVQLYVHDNESSVVRPFKELKEFKKVFIKAGETQVVSINLAAEAFAFYDETIHDWKTESGVFTIYICSASDSVELECEILVK